MSKSAANQGTARPFTGWHMLAIMIAFFGVIVSVNVFMAVMANRAWTGLVVKNTYVASQHFNEKLSSARAQKLRGWQSALAYNDGELVLKLVDKDSAAVSLDALAVSIGRPAYEAADQTLRLAHTGDGRYSARLALAPGLWFVNIVSTDPAQPYRRESRLIVGADGGGREK